MKTGPLFLILTLTLALGALTARGVTALGTPGILDWDETYYASTTSTSAHGLGFYPYALGYPQIHNMGGVGYIVTLYVLAYKLLGPHLLALRLVAFLASLIAVAGVSILTRKWYGTAAGLAALALTPALLLFQLTNTIRVDVFAIAFVAWALVLYTAAARRPPSLTVAGLVGLTFALGLEVHLHTAAAAFAVGFAYVVRAFDALRKERSSLWPAAKPAVGFAAGYMTGVALFLAVHVLPDPQGFFRTAALARLSATEASSDLNLTAPMNRSQLAETFLSPAAIVPKEIARYRGLFRDMTWWERLLWIAALPLFVLIRSRPPGISARGLMAGAVLGGGIVFNSSSPLYFSAILPFFVPALATLVTHGLGKQAQVDWRNVSAGSVIAMLLLAIVSVPTVLSRNSAALARLRQPAPADTPPAVIALIKETASPACIIAGPADHYAQYLMAYPKFVGTRRVEVLIGSTYYDLQGQIVRYWHQKHPDLVFGEPDPELATYLAEAGYIPIAQSVWRKPDLLSAGCTIYGRG